MPSTHGGQQPSPGDLRKTMRERKRNEKMLFEAMTRRQKIPKAQVTTGGYLGTAQLTSTPGSVIQTASGARIDEGSVTYSAPTDPHSGTGGEGLAPSGWCSVSGNAITLDEGWHSVALMIDAAWATPANAPDSCGVFVAGLPNEIAEYAYFPAVTAGGRKGFRFQVNTGPFYAGFGPLWVEVELGPHSGTSDSLIGLGGSASASHVWTIVKHT